MKSKSKKLLKIALWSGASLLIAALAAVAVCEWLVERNARGRAFDDVADVPARRVALVLGTSPISTWTGTRSYYFDHRIKAAADLYHAGKADYLIVSGGDYRNTPERGYDEPLAMRDSLMRLGVDSSRIVLDYDGTRTLNSIAKIRDIYRLDSIIIVSQTFHNKRALYQAKHLGINAIAYNARTPGHTQSWWRNRGRESLARVKLFLDIVTGVQPDIKETAAWRMPDEAPDAELIAVSHISTPHGDLICLTPDMTRLSADLECLNIPNADSDSIILAFAGAFTGTEPSAGHRNIAGDHVSHGIKHRGYRCKRCNGAFAWTPGGGHIFSYQDLDATLDAAAAGGGMAFTQEMIIHDGEKVSTTRPLDNRHQFRALCQGPAGELMLCESQGIVAFGDFIQALLHAGVTEAIYTDMGPGWNYCFYRSAPSADTRYFHPVPAPTASNFIVLKVAKGN